MDNDLTRGTGTERTVEKSAFVTAAVGVVIHPLAIPTGAANAPLEVVCGTK